MPRLESVARRSIVTSRPTISLRPVGVSTQRRVPKDQFRASTERSEAALAAIERHMQSAQRPRESREYSLLPLDSRLLTYEGEVKDPLAFATAADVMKHCPPYIQEAVFPEGGDKGNVAVLDFDGVCTVPGVAIGRLVYNYANARGFILSGTKYAGRTTVNYIGAKMGLLLRTKSNFLGVHISGATIYAGLTEAKIRTIMQEFFDKVIMDLRFNQQVVPTGEEGNEQVMPRPYLHRKVLEYLLGRAQCGGVNVIASGSLRFVVETLFKPENISRYAKQFHGLDIPADKPLVHFVIGSGPAFKDAEGERTATTIAQYPLNVGIAKLANVMGLCQVWEVDPNSLIVHSDDLLDLPLLTKLGKPETQWATDLPADQSRFAEVFELKTMTFDDHPRPLTVDEGVASELLLGEYLQDVVVDVAREENIRTAPSAKSKKKKS